MIFAFLCCISSNLERDPHLIKQYEGGCKNSVVEIRALKIKMVEEEHVVLTTNNFQQFLSKILIKVWEKFLAHLASVLQLFHTIYRALESWKKPINGFLMSWMNIKNLGDLKFSKCFVCITPTIFFMPELSLVTKIGSFMIIINNLVNGLIVITPPKTSQI